MKLVLLLVAAVTGSPLENTAPVEEAKVEEAKVAEPGADRDGKLFSVFQIVKFNNDPCTSSDGLMGTCYTAAECTDLGGEGRGACAAGFGTCCVSVVDPNCPVTIMLNNSYIVNPGYPGNLDTAAACASTGQGRAGVPAPRIFFPVAATTTTTTTTTASSVSGGSSGITFPHTYTYDILKASSSVVQIRLDFIDFDIAPPAMGDCTNETLTITGVDAVSMKVLPTNLCGVLTGQHMYLSVKSSTKVQIMITITGSRTQSWNILVSQYEDSQTDILAPRGCLQYYSKPADKFSSFNYNSGAGELLNNHMYTTCLAQSDDYCDVSLTAGGFDLGGTSGNCNDAISFGTSSYCGSTFANAGMLLWNYTGSYTIPMMSDADNTNMNIGYEISYIMLPC